MFGKGVKANRPIVSQGVSKDPKTHVPDNHHRIRVHGHDKPKHPRKPTKLSPTKNTEENKENLRVDKKYETIVENCMLLGTKYVDIDFPATKASLFRSVHTRDSGKQSTEQFIKNARSITSWQRPENIRMSGEANWTLIQSPQPSDICQGELGNCWFVAALALIAERKELLAKILVTKEINDVGVYVIRLFKDGTWTEVILDNLLPCDTYHRLVFSSCRRKQLWVPLIEKAMSRLHGSYESLQSGSIWDGLNYLTGFVSERIFLDRELLWGRLLSFVSCGFLMGTTITTTTELESIYERKGLVTNHVYSVLQVVANDGNRLIQLRNPWGRFSWNGDWSDTSCLWTKPRTKQMRQTLSPNQSHEGVFWMSYQDFMRYFTCLEVCKVRQGWKSYSMDGILLPYADLQPCFELICTSSSCEVDISLYQSSKRNARELVKLTDIGFIVFETNGSSSKIFKLIEPIEFVTSSRRRCVTCNVMLSAGKYCVIPFSFGHWTTMEGHKETFYAFTLSIYSSRDLKCSSIRPSNHTNLLADALISCANKYGKKKRYSLKEKYDDISTISLNLGSGYCTILTNHSSKYIEFQMESKTGQNYNNTRGAFRTCYRLNPHHSQVIQVLTAKDSGKSSRISNSYQLQVYDTLKQMQMELQDTKKMHEPLIDTRISGLHTSRPVINH